MKPNEKKYFPHPSPCNKTFAVPSTSQVALWNRGRPSAGIKLGGRIG
jgi:hypothetical protein